jgi:hypothetical protein
MNKGTDKLKAAQDLERARQELLRRGSVRLVPEKPDAERRDELGDIQAATQQASHAHK